MRTRGLFRSWMWIAYVLTLLSAISACVPYLELTDPMIVVSPTGGGAGTRVAVSGSGFPPKVRVSVRLGPPSVGATPYSYGETTTGVDGKFSLSFMAPAFWPDGAPIGETDLVVVVLTLDGSAKATAPFAYVPASSAEALALPREPEAERSLVLGWHREGSVDGFCGDVLVYEDGSVEIISCTPSAPVEQRQLARDAVEQLHAWVSVYRSFRVEQIQGTGPSRVQTRTTFMGRGERSISDVELRMIQALIERQIVPRS